MKRFFCAILMCFSAGVSPGQPDLKAIKLPAGFHISLYVSDIPGARSMTFGRGGILFVGTRAEGKVYAVLPPAHDSKAAVVTIAAGLHSPNGVAYRNGTLYVAEINRVVRFDGIDDHLNNPPKPIVVNDSFPSDEMHGWKFIRFGPDGKLYVPVGAPCNVCEREDKRYASIMRMNPDGTALELFASGIRNTVGFDWNPQTKELWFTDNGRDWLGDDQPPDELNVAPRKGLHFGFPYCHGGDIPDPDYGKQYSCTEFVPPALKLGPHVAALGLRFYTGTMFPSSYKNQIFIAEHGSWNRSKKIGYRISLVHLEGNAAVGYEPFAQGWLSGEHVSGRPVDVEIAPDGALLVSDDYSGCIYRIWYAK